MRRVLAVVVVGALALAGTAPVAHADLRSVRSVTLAAPAYGADGVRSWSLDLASTPGTTTSPEIRTAEITLAALSWPREVPSP